MSIENGFMIFATTAIAVGGWFLKRIFKLLDDGAAKMNGIEVDVTMLKSYQSDDRDRLDRIEAKIDRLLDRERK